MSRGRPAIPRTLLKLWAENRDAEMPFSEIVSKADRKFGFDERTTIRYLNWLTKTGQLEKRIDLKRRTYYKVDKKEEIDKEVLKEKVDEMQNPDATLLLSMLTINFVSEISKSADVEPNTLDVNEAAKALQKAKAQAMKSFRAIKGFEKELKAYQKGSD
jgi:hypothetical protein